LSQTLVQVNFNARLAQFLKIDVALGLTFAGIALHAIRDPKKRERNRINARKAYDAVTTFRGRTELGVDDAAQVSGDLKRLRSALESLGEIVPTTI
jgi:hypothetical protein